MAAASSIARRSIATAVLPPHPLLSTDFQKAGELRDGAEDYQTKGYTDYPDGMNAYHTPNVIYFQELQDRWAALAELIEKKDATLLLSKWYQLFPSLIRATKGDAEFYELAFAHETGVEPSAALYKSLEKFIKSEEGVKALKAQQAHAQYLIDSFLAETPTVLSFDQINHVLTLSPENQKQFLWDEFGYDLDQRAKVAGVSNEEFIKSLGLSDAKTLDTYLKEIKDETKMILKYQHFVPSLDADKAIRAHLESKEVKDAIAAIRSGSVTDAAKAAALLESIIGLPKKKISEMALQIIRDVPTNSNIESSEKDYLRLNYFDPEMGNEKVADPLNLHKYSFASMSKNDRYKYARVAWVALAFGGVSLILSCGTEHFHWVHENHGLWPGSRSAKFWASQQHIPNL